jgi:RNA polymerase sigma factor (sigma-70 family)
MTENIEDARRLISRATAGDKAAFDTFARRYRSWFIDQIEKALTQYRGYSLGLDPEYVLNEFLIHLWSYWSKRHPSPPASPSAYFTRAIRRQCYMALRKAGKEKRITISLEELGEREPCEDLYEAETSLLRKRVQEAISQLSKRERKVVILRCNEKLPWKDVARRLGLTIDQARYLFIRAKANVRKRLAR